MRSLIETIRSALEAEAEVSELALSGREDLHRTAQLVGDELLKMPQGKDRLAVSDRMHSILNLPKPALNDAILTYLAQRRPDLKPEIFRAFIRIDRQGDHVMFQPTTPIWKMKPGQ